MDKIGGVENSGICKTTENNPAMLQKLLWLSVASVFAVATVYSIRKNRNWWAVISALLVEFFIFCGMSAIKAQSPVDQIACIIGGSLFAALAFKFLENNKLAESFLITLIAAGCFFCSLSGVQTLLKTTLLARVTQALVKYGDKIESFQLTIGDLSLKLQNQQDEIQKQQTNIATAQNRLDKQGRNIDHQYTDITNIQNKVQAAEEDIVKQQKQVRDIESSVRDILARSWVTELISANDTNSCIGRLLGDNSQRVFLLLNSAPLASSIQCIVLGPHIPQMSLSVPKQAGNLIYYQMGKGTDLRDANLSVSYFRDSSVQKCFTNMVPFGETVKVDGMLLTP